MNRSLKLFLTRAGIVVAFISFLPAVIAADDLQSLKEENAELRQRFDKLSNELSQIKELLAKQGVTATIKPVTTQNVTAKSLDLQLYGMIKLDAAHDDSRVNNGNFARWVESESVLNNDRHFNLTANQTRLGVDISAPQIDGIRTSAKVEADFYGAGTGENKPELMLRHAYVQADWPDWKFTIIAGQTFDIISPLSPNTVNYSVGWWQGNVGYRRPQIRLVKTIGLDEGVDLKLEGGISRTITGRKYVFKESTDPDTGADAGFPTTAGRVSLSFPVWEKQQATIGVSGHYGQEEVHATNLLSSAEYATWSINVDVRLPITKWLLLQAEGFIGENFDSYLGGIGQGINLTLNKEIQALAKSEQISYQDIGKGLLSKNGKINDQLFSDGLHPNATGYEVLGKQLVQVLKR